MDGGAPDLLNLHRFDYNITVLPYGQYGNLAAVISNAHVSDVGEGCGKYHQKCGWYGVLAMMRHNQRLHATLTVMSRWTPTRAL